MSAEEVNDQLASACQKCGASCCKKGKIFLSLAEHARLRGYVFEMSGDSLSEFDARVSDHGLFFLYDQRTGCQFLDEKNLCRLHDLGLKPSECFWWPYHVFISETQQLEVRLFTTCCDAHEAHRDDSPYPAMIAAQAGEMGFDVIEAFRKAYAGSSGTKLVARINTVSATISESSLSSLNDSGGSLFTPP